jgi:hypothetical protein
MPTMLERQGREAAVDELYKNYIKAEYFYRNGLLLLELLLYEAVDVADKKVLKECIAAMYLRL